MLTISVIVILSYLLGSIPSAVIVSKAFKGIDVRDYGSKSAGFTNVYRVMGVLPAFIVLIIDIGKGIVAVLLVTQISFSFLVTYFQFLRDSEAVKELRPGWVLFFP